MIGVIDVFALLKGLRADDLDFNLLRSPLAASMFPSSFARSFVDWRC